MPELSSVRIVGGVFSAPQGDYINANVLVGVKFNSWEVTLLNAAGDTPMYELRGKIFMHGKSMEMTSIKLPDRVIDKYGHRTVIPGGSMLVPLMTTIEVEVGSLGPLAIPGEGDTEFATDMTFTLDGAGELPSIQRPQDLITSPMWAVVELNNTPIGPPTHVEATSASVLVPLGKLDAARKRMHEVVPVP